MKECEHGISGEPCPDCIKEYHAEQASDSNGLLCVAREVYKHWSPHGGEWEDPLMTTELYDSLEAFSEYFEEHFDT